MSPVEKSSPAHAAIERPIQSKRGTRVVRNQAIGLRRGDVDAMSMYTTRANHAFEEDKVRLDADKFDPAPIGSRIRRHQNGKFRK